MEKPLNAKDIFGNSPPLQNLVDELEDMYPQLNPSPKDDDRTLMYRAGQRSVVEYVKQKLELCAHPVPQNPLKSQK